MSAFIRFNKGLMKSPIHVRLWLMLLVALNLVAPLFFLERLEAQMVLGAFLASIMLMTVLTGLTGFARLLGVGHILWVPLLYFLWIRLGQIPPTDGFGI